MKNRIITLMVFLIFCIVSKGEIITTSSPDSIIWTINVDISPLTEAMIEDSLGIGDNSTIFRIRVADGIIVTVEDALDLTAYENLNIRLKGEDSQMQFVANGSSSGELHLHDNAGFFVNPANDDAVIGTGAGGQVRIMIGTKSPASKNTLVKEGNFVDFIANGGVTSGGILPITLHYFTGNQSNTHIELTWATLTEKNNDRIEILRSSDLINWQVIGEVNGYGTTNSLMTYSYIDKNPASGDNYYKLKQYDYNGDTEEHVIIAVEFLMEIGVYPNPSNGNITVHLKESDRNVGFNYEVTSVGHYVVSKGSLEGELTNLSLNVENGIYILKVYSANTTYYAKLLIDTK